MSMIYQETSSFGKQIAIYTRYRVLEDPTKAVDTSKTIYAGRAVTLNASGAVTPVVDDSKVYGLAKFQKNVYMDEVSGTNPSGVYGSGRGTVVVKGIVDVCPNVFTLTDGTECTIANWDVAGCYLPMAPLYVKDELLTTDSCCSATLLGYVLNYDATSSVLQILLP